METLSDTLELLTLKQLAQKTQLSLPTLNREIARGNLAALKIGRSTRIAATEAKRWIEARQRPAQRAA